jgi:hypothetical protein
MGEMAHTEPGSTEPGPGPVPVPLRTGDVDDLVRRATGHPLGLDFLRTGSLDAVSATFRVHAFVVDAARDVLATSGVAAAAR